jgi:hypothetical protein
MATALDEDIKDVPVLVNGAPQVVTLAVNREEDLIEMPRVARSGTLPPELMGILLTKFPALLPDGFIGHADSAFEEELFDIAVAEAAAKIQPHRMADDLGREAVILVAVGAYWCSHPSSISHPTTAQQVDNADGTPSRNRRARVAVCGADEGEKVGVDHGLWRSEPIPRHVRPAMRLAIVTWSKAVEIAIPEI